VTGGGLATVKAELRRLVLGPEPLAENETLTRTFIVNTRNPRIALPEGAPARRVKLKAPRETTQEAWAWDDALTLELHGATLSAVEIAPAQVPTVFLLGDSTLCDQSLEPFASWGQMLPRFFEPTVAVANHGESGETYRDSISRGRLDKIVGVMRPGDTLVMQFGHNDQKQIAAGTGGPFSTYQSEIKTHIAAVRDNPPPSSTPRISPVTAAPRLTSSSCAATRRAGNTPSNSPINSPTVISPIRFFDNGRIPAAPRGITRNTRPSLLIFPILSHSTPYPLPQPVTYNPPSGPTAMSTGRYNASPPVTKSPHFPPSGTISDPSHDGRNTCVRFSSQSFTRNTPRHAAGHVGTSTNTTPVPLP
jgi:hypothetical protein